MSNFRERPSVYVLQQEYESGNQKRLKDLFEAFAHIKSLPANDHNSFFKIAGYHGLGIDFDESADFHLPADNDPSIPYYGGYCVHHLPLFVTWHRAYVLRFEKALQSKNPEVMLPYWDEFGETSPNIEVPWVFTRKTVQFTDGPVENPLVSYKLPYSLKYPGQDTFRPKDYETCRYPLTGDYTTMTKDQIDAYNAQFPDYDKNTQALNDNLHAHIDDIHQDYRAALKSTVFSEYSSNSSTVPHDAIHVYVGTDDNGQSVGDMSLQEMAAFDPIFWFHHCFVDFQFWQWQKINNSTKTITIDDQNLNEPLKPFKLTNGNWYTTKDVIDIEALGYSYPNTGPQPTLGKNRKLLRGAIHSKTSFSTKKLIVSGIDRSKIAGSFVVTAYAVSSVSKNKYYLGSVASFNRNNALLCNNCLNNLEFSHTFSLASVPAAEEPNLSFNVKLKWKNQSFESLGITPLISLVD